MGAVRRARIGTRARGHTPRFAALLLLGMSAASGCSDGRSGGPLNLSDSQAAVLVGGLGVALVTAPVWYPASVLFEAAGGLLPDNRQPEIVSSNPNAAVEVRRVEVPGGFGDRGTALLPDGSGRFMVLHSPVGGTRGPQGVSVLDARTGQVLSTRPLPFEVVPWGVRDGALYAQREPYANGEDRALHLILREGAAAAEVRPLPSGCGGHKLVSSPRTLFAACVTYANGEVTGATILNLQTGATRPVPAREVPTFAPVVTDDGRFADKVGDERVERAADQTGNIIGESLWYDGHAAGPSGVVSVSTYSGQDGVPRVRVTALGGQTVFDAANRGTLQTVFVSNRGRIALVGFETIFVVTPGRAVTWISMPGNSKPTSKVFGAAWDESGDRLLLLRGNGKGYVFGFLSVGATLPAGRS